jgi:transcription termination/antitermination protein NusA
MEVIVPDDQLSLAIGKRGQNVRLAHRLSGWKLDVRSDSEAEEEARTARASLNAIPGIGDINAELLYQWGFRSAEQLADANENNFEVEGISPERARQVIHAAREWVARKRVEQVKQPDSDDSLAATPEPDSSAGPVHSSDETPLATTASTADAEDAEAE